MGHQLLPFTRWTTVVCRGSNWTMLQKKHWNSSLVQTPPMTSTRTHSWAMVQRFCYSKNAFLLGWDSEVNWGEVKESELNWTKVKWTYIKESGVEWSGVEWSGVEESEVNIRGSVTSSGTTLQWTMERQDVLFKLFSHVVVWMRNKIYYTEVRRCFLSGC